MKANSLLLAAFFCLCNLVAVALSLPPVSLNKREDCFNSPSRRDCWTPGFDINTDIYDKWPQTGQTWTYDLRITNTTCNPDGGPVRYCQLINGAYPGPTIRANWGDNIRVIVHNDMQDNGTSIHWHGLRQLNSNEQDGVNGVTECPIAPGTTKTYEFKALQHGTTWYHSHYSLQYAEGIVGTIIIDGPASANYDEDLGVLPLTDWFYNEAFMLLWRALYGRGGPPPSQTVLVNGTMVNAAGGGRYTKLSIQKGKKYRLRFVNTAADHFFHVSLDGHPFTVISADFVPVTPYQTTDLKIAIGQRYDVVFTADQDVANYWLRVQPGPNGCGRAQIYNNPNVTVGAILQYEGSNPEELPSSTPYTLTTTCEDEVFTPYKAIPVPSETFQSQVDSLPITLGRSSDGRNIVNWFVRGSSMDVDWEKPTLEFIRTGNTSYLPSMNVLELPKANEWYFWVIQNTNAPAIAHPIHLHGHDFWFLGSGPGTFPGTTDGLNFVNPLRRDVATLPAGGYMVIAFPTDNPGSWLSHCHIAFHASQGFSLQFLERRDEIIKSIGNLNEFDQGCKDWKAWWNSPLRVYQDEDSGLLLPNPPFLSGPGSGV